MPLVTGFSKLALTFKISPFWTNTSRKHASGQSCAHIVVIVLIEGLSMAK
jgi:hypothetical protein